MNWIYEPYKMNSCYDGKQYLFRFENGYEASVVNQYSYGGNEGEWELAVIRNDKIGNRSIINVLGYLDEDDVNQTLTDIKELPNANL
jgi:hypothetical protein